MHRGPKTAVAAISAALTLLAGSCSTDTASEVDAQAEASTIPEAFTKLPSTRAVGDCAPGSGVTAQDGVVTIATDSPSYQPWFVDGDPSNGKGYEGAVAREVVEKLGYGPDQVQFETVGFNDALAPGEKNFDFAIDQFTIVDTRRETVDFSSPYYAVTQSVLALKNSPAARAKSLADLAPFRLGAQVGSTSFDAITQTVQPRQAPVSFTTTDDAKAALAAGDIDALVVDIPTGFQITANEVKDSVLVGQFPRPNAVTEFFGLVLEKNSPLTACVSAAVDSLYADGTLDALAAEWITDTGGAHVLD